MKIRIKSGDCPDYLTVGKVYKANNVIEQSGNTYFSIICDDGIHINTRLHNCIMFLSGGEWEIVND